MKKNSNILKFIDDLKAVCHRENVRLFLPKTLTVKFDKKSRTNGWFDSNPLALACGMKNPEAIQILVHESCHLDQYLENSLEWKKSLNGMIVHKWLMGRRVDLKTIKKEITALRNVELDCEIRSIEKIKKYKLPINIQTYIQKANAYIWFHTFIYENRFWPKPKHSPIMIKSIWKKMPKKFQKDYSDIPENIKQVFEHNYSQYICR